MQLQLFINLQEKETRLVSYKARDGFVMIARCVRPYLCRFFETEAKVPNPSIPLRHYTSLSWGTHLADNSSYEDEWWLSDLEDVCWPSRLVYASCIGSLSRRKTLSLDNAIKWGIFSLVDSSLAPDNSLSHVDDPVSMYCCREMRKWDFGQSKLKSFLSASKAILTEDKRFVRMESNIWTRCVNVGLLIGFSTQQFCIIS